MYKTIYFIIFLLFSLNSLSFAQSPEVFDVPSDEFPTLASVVNYINQNGAGDNGVVFNVAGNSTFTEPHLTLTASGSVTAKIIIQWDGQGDKPIINFSGSAADGEAGFTLEGASYYIIDGLDIRNPDGLLEYGILLTNADAETGSQNNIIRNTHITLDKNNSNQTNGIRVFTQHEQTSHSGSNSNNSFLNNHISNTLLGYVLNSNTGTVELMDSGNIVGITEGGEHIVEDIVFSGVYLLNQNGATVNGVTIRNLNRPNDGTNTAPAAISTTGSLPSGELTNPMVISNNRIEDQYTDGTSIFGMYLNQRNVHNQVYNNVLHNILTEGGGNTYASGIFLFATGSTADIYNNMISDIAAPLSTTSITSGIYVRLFVAANIYYNSVRLGYVSGIGTNRSAALYIHNASSPVEMKNNIFVNKSGFTAPGSGYAAAFYKNTASLANISADTDNNIYYAGTPSADNLIFVGGTEQDQTLAAYKTRAATFDQGSFTEDVQFIPGYGLYVDPLATTVVRENAQPISTPIVIDTDIDGKLRDPENPDIGAAELPNPYPVEASNPQPENQQQDVPVTLQNLQWEYHPDPDHVNPEGFRVYFGINEHQGVDQYIGWVEYEAGQTVFTKELEVNEALEYETIYYWQILPSIDEEIGPFTPEVDTWSFTTEAFVYDYPNLATNPQPENGTTEVSLELEQLTWDFVHDETYALPAGFHVYLGTSEEPGEDELLGWVEFDEEQQQYSINTGTIEFLPLTDYFWKVVPSVDEVEGPINPEAEVWSFTSEAFIFEYPNAAQNPTPVDGEIEVSLLLAELSWEFVHDDDYTLPAGFWVYLGTSDTFTETDQLGWVAYVDQQETYSISLEEDLLIPLTEYFWQVLPSVDMQDGPVAPDAAVWSFTTDDETSIPESGEMAFHIYPNPAGNTIYVSSQQGGKLEIHSLDGRLTDAKEITGGITSLDVSHLPSGTYIIRIIAERTVISRMLIIRN